MYLKPLFISLTLIFFVKFLDAFLSNLTKTGVLIFKVSLATIAADSASEHV